MLGCLDVFTQKRLNGIGFFFFVVSMIYLIYTVFYLYKWNWFGTFGSEVAYTLVLFISKKNTLLVE